MHTQKQEQTAFERRTHAAWRMRACAVGLCTGVQVFLFGAGIAMPVCANAAWLAALCTLPAAALAVGGCHRALNRWKGRYSRALYRVLLASFLLGAVFSAASLVGLAEQSLLSQAQSVYSVIITVLAALLCALGGAAGVYRLSFALRWVLPVLTAVLCAVSLPLDISFGLFPLLGTGAPSLLLGGIVLLGAVQPSLLLLYMPQELSQLCDRQEAIGIPRAGFFIWRAVLGAAAGTALLLALTLGNTYESILRGGAWGDRLLILSSGKPREGVAQMSLTILEVLSTALLVVHMLLGAARAASALWPRLERAKAGLMLCAGLVAAALYAMLFAGERIMPGIACGMLALLPAALILCQWRGRTS